MREVEGMMKFGLLWRQPCRLHSFVSQATRLPLQLIGHSCFIICSLLFIVGSNTLFAQKRNITEKDLFDFVWIGDPQISPDGMRVAFVRITANEKREGYNTSVWSVPVAGGETPHQLTKGGQRKFAIRHRCHKKFRESDGDTEGRTSRGCEKSGGRSGTRERHSRDHAGGLPGRQ